MFIIDFLIRCASYCYKRDTLFVYFFDNAKTLRGAPPLPAGLAPYACDRDNLELVKTLIKPFPRMIESRIKHDNLAFFAISKSRWIFRACVVLGPKEYPIAGFPLRFTATDAYLECAETIPAWRGKGVAPGMVNITMQTLLARGYSRSFLTIAITNTSSCRAAEKGGAQRIGIISGTRLFGHWQSRYISLTVDERFACLAQ